MFTPCPHCGFLVALIVSRGGAAQLCPRCNHALRSEPEAQTATETAPATRPQPAPDVGATPEGQPGASPPAGAAADTAAVPEAPAATPTRDPAMAADPGADIPGKPANTTAAAAPASPPGAPSAKPDRHRQRSRHTTPSFTRPRKAAPATGPRWPARAVIGVLAAALVAQLILAQRAQLAADASWRPLIAGICTIAGCDLPPWRQPGAFTMLNRTVQPAPDQPGALLVSASFRNDARWPQPWPRLQLTLSDRNGQPVAQRLFTAAQYRGDAPTGPLAPGQSAGVSFMVVEPRAASVAFNFDFR